MAELFEKLVPICRVPFGRAFLMRLIGLDWTDINNHSFALITATLNNFEFSQNEFLRIFDAFIREYSFGFFEEWNNLEVPPIQIQDHLVEFVQRFENEFIDAGLLNGFAQQRQKTIQLLGGSKARVPSFESSELNASGWWTAPSALRTFQPLGSESGIIALDDADYTPRALMVQSIQINGEPNVLPIESTGDWVALVNRWPKTRQTTENAKYISNKLDFIVQEQYLVPNYEQVRREYDAIYLSPAAYLSTAYRDVPTGDGRFTLLSGWSPGSTYWFELDAFLML